MTLAGAIYLTAAGRRVEGQVSFVPACGRQTFIEAITLRAMVEAFVGRVGPGVKKKLMLGRGFIDAARNSSRSAHEPAKFMGRIAGGIGLTVVIKTMHVMVQRPLILAGG